MTIPPILSEPWPPGVLARCLTAGWGAVDVSRIEGSAYSQAACSGCETTFKATGVSKDLEGEEYAGRANESIARRWAKRHAAGCSWMPKPPADTCST